MLKIARDVEETQRVITINAPKRLDKFPPKHKERLQI